MTTAPPTNPEALREALADRCDYLVDTFPITFHGEPALECRLPAGHDGEHIVQDARGRWHAWYPDDCDCNEGGCGCIIHGEITEAEALHAIQSCPVDPVATLIAERDAALAERDEARRMCANRRWNIDEDGDDLVVCKGLHEKGEDCDRERYVPERKRDAATAQAERTAGELAAAEAEKVRLKAQVATLLGVIDAGKCEAGFALDDETDSFATPQTRRIQLTNIRDALEGVGDIEARKALGLLVETIDGEVTRAALTEEPPHAE